MKNMAGEKDNLVFGVSEKIDGQMRLAINAKNIPALNNRRKFFKKIGLDPRQSVACDLVHGAGIRTAGKKQAGKILIACDGLISREKNLILTVTVADCLPLFFYDPEKKVIGVAHAGWRGVWQNMTKAMIEEMKKKFNSRPQDIQLVVGAHIKKCHFDIDPDLAKEFKTYKKFLSWGRGRVKVDLGGIVRKQALNAGVKKENIEVSDRCTFCDKKYFSNRRDKPQTVEAMVAYIVKK